MLLSAHYLTGFRLQARDGQIGEIASLLFDDRTWTIRYFVARTMRWLGREVLLSPSAVGATDGDSKSIDVDLTREQIKNSPNLSADAPVSRQYLHELHRHYAWPVWWGAPGSVASIPPATAHGEMPQEGDGDPHLRSTVAVDGSHVKTTDGELGHVQDFIVEDRGWEIRFLVVDTGSWLPGRKVLILPEHASGLDWPKRELQVDLTRDQVADSPEYDPQAPVNPVLEERVYDFYGRETAKGR